MAGKLDKAKGKAKGKAKDALDAAGKKTQKAGAKLEKASGKSTKKAKSKG